MQRVQGEQECDERAAPAGARGAIEKGEQQQRRQPMEEHVGEMMQAALPAEKLVGDQVRQAGQRNPAHVIAGGQRPFDSVERDALKHVGIAEDFRVVEIDKVKLPDLDIHEERDDEKAQTDPQVVPRDRRRLRLSPGWCARPFPDARWLRTGLTHERPSSGASAADRKRLRKTRDYHTASDPFFQLGIAE